MIDKMKQSKPYPKPTTKMVIDQTLRGYYAMNAPDVPDWFKGESPNLPKEPLINAENKFWTEYNLSLAKWCVDNSEEIFFQWRWYYADKMIEMETKK